MKYKKQIATGALAISLLVGTIYSVNKDGFTLQIRNAKTKSSSSIDVKTSNNTLFSKNGFETQPSDLSVGKKAIVKGDLDNTTDILAAKMVKIVANQKNL